MNLFRITLLSFFCSFASFINAQLTPETVNGVYHLTTAERGKQQLLMQYGELNGKTVIATAACKGCPPAVYSFQQEASKTLNTPVFYTSGLYLIRFDDESFALVQPDKELGRAVWQKIGHANLYSKNKTTAQSTSREQIEQFAIRLSGSIMSQEVGELTHDSGTYHLAAPMTHMGKSVREYQIAFKSDEPKQITITPCGNCGQQTYELLPQESAIIGVDVYRHASSYYLFDIKDGVLIYTFANASGLGKTDWSEHSKYNLYSSNLAYVRQLLTSKEKQQAIDTAMAGYFSQIKNEFERLAKEQQQQATENRELPTAGYNNGAEQQQALKAAKRWANAWSWKESIEDVYFASNNWSTTRHPLTGVITGKVIRGIATMKHPDGRCRFQHTSFRQDFDGQKYFNLNMTGVGPIYDIRCDKI